MKRRPTDDDDRDVPRSRRSGGPELWVLLAFGGGLLLVVGLVVVGAFFFMLRGQGPAPIAQQNVPAVAEPDDSMTVTTAPANPTARTVPTKAAPPTAQPERVEGLEKEQVVGGVGVQVIHSAVMDDGLLVTVLVRGLDDRRKYDYRGWEPPLVGRRPGPTLADDLGNAYRPVRVSDFLRAALASGVREQMGDKAAYGPGAFSVGRPRADTLAFERPIAKAGYVDLDLPGEAVGVDGTFRFRVRADAWREKAGGKAAPTRR